MCNIKQQKITITIFMAEIIFFHRTITIPNPCTSPINFYLSRLGAADHIISWDYAPQRVTSYNEHYCRVIQFIHQICLVSF